MRVDDLKRELAELADSLPFEKELPVDGVTLRVRRRHLMWKSFVVGIAGVAAAVLLVLILTLAHAPQQVFVQSGSTGQRVTISTACPAHAPTFSVLGSPPMAPATARRQVVPDAPTEVRLCRYSGLNTKAPLALVGQKLLIDASQVDRLRSSLNSLPPPIRRVL